MKYLSLGIPVLMTVLAVCACTQSTPSMVNQNSVELVEETVIEQIALADINDVTISSIATQYRKYGNGPLELAIAYDPKSKTFTALSALQKLQEIKKKLARVGIKTVLTETISAENAKPVLLVSYDSVSAQAPSSCDPMPGIDNTTTRFIGDYKFGCGIETMLARQISKPSDLKGNDQMDQTRSARRESVVQDRYNSGLPLDPLTIIDRSNIGSQ